MNPFQQPIQVQISKVEGGYIVQLPTGPLVTTSLQKAIKLTRDALADSTEAGTEE